MASDSLIGYGVGTMSDPVTGADSRIGFAVGKTRWPHRPIAVMVGGTLVHIPVYVGQGIGEFKTAFQPTF